MMHQRLHSFLTACTQALEEINVKVPFPSLVTLEFVD